jgi:hypothetical protein
MLWLVHILIGMIIGVQFKSPWLIIPIAILSHFILDGIPHWDGNFDKKEFKKTKTAVITDTDIIVKFLDVIASIAVISYFYMQSDKGLMVLGAVMAILPDLSKVGYLTKLRNTKGYMHFIMFHNNIQRETTMKNGLSIQAVCFILLIIVLIHML